jgi:hypothetical protein
MITSIREYINEKIMKINLGLIPYEGYQDDNKITFVNDREKLMRMKIHEYDVWYSGDGDELLNFYTQKTNIDYNYEPFYDRNKRGYFWSISSTEEDIKRTHSGVVKTIVDTLVNIINTPDVSCEETEILEKILDENNFDWIYKQEQMPFTMVEGWGAYKINWDMDMSDYPIIEYYKADSVYFIYTRKRITGIIFLDFYFDDKGKKYLLVETRRRYKKDLIIEKELFETYGDDEAIKKVPFSTLPVLKDTVAYMKLDNYKGFLATPCVFFKDIEADRPGRSIFEGKIDLCDDYDQCFSQRANSVRKSTPIEYFNSDFLEKDPRTGITIQPKVYDRKYLMYTGGKDANGNSNTNSPVEVTEPHLQFQQYDGEANAILTEILSGILSPASLGIDVSRRDNAASQREKEKVTVFTRNAIIKSEKRIISQLCNELLCAYELMHTQQITKFEYDVTVKYGEFADASYENKLNVLTGALSAGTISPKMFMKKLYGNDTLSKSEYDEELQFLEAERNVQQMMHIGGAPGQDVDDEDEIDEGTLPAEGTENEEENNASEMLGALLGAKK